jgi:hypothetical protein
MVLGDPFVESGLILQHVLGSSPVHAAPLWSAEQHLYSIGAVSISLLPLSSEGWYIPSRPEHR